MKVRGWMLAAMAVAIVGMGCYQVGQDAPFLTIFQKTTINKEDVLSLVGNTEAMNYDDFNLYGSLDDVENGSWLPAVEVAGTAVSKKSAEAEDVATELSRRASIESQFVLLNNRHLPLSTMHANWLVRPQRLTFAAFLQAGARYANLRDLSWSDASLPSALKQATDEQPIILVTTDDDRRALNNAHWWRNWQSVAQRQPLVLVHFGRAELLRLAVPEMTILWSPERSALAETLAAQAVYGAVAIKGRLALDINGHLRRGDGEDLTPSRLKYTIPEEVGIDSRRLADIDKIAAQAIQRWATPGCQVLVAKDGKVIYEKAFGKHTYGKSSPSVNTDDLYDLASITKAAGSGLAFMRLYEDKKLSPEGRLSDYASAHRRSKFRNFKLKHLMAHNTSIQSNLPLYKFLRRKDMYASGLDSLHHVPLTEHLYLADESREAVFQRMNVALIERGKGSYKYSDVNYVLLQQAVEDAAGQRLDALLDQAYYRPLGLRRFTYTPALRFPLTDIVPTAVDKRWRKRLLHGEVHDEGASLLAGVGGHAGLFGNASDLAVLFQMLLNNGVYGDQRFLSPATIDKFTKPSGLNYRGLAFDRLVGHGKSLLKLGASDRTFGHTGFTGGCVWADPENDLIFVFLSNRVHPNPYNHKLSKLGIRERMHRVVYGSLGTYRGA